MVLLIYAIVGLARNSVPPSSTFCQISGFALAIGIEASDVAVLLIALHSAMYILRPRAGLYPYRHFAYLAFYLFPTVAACLTFIAGKGYRDMGPYCYLRTDRRWARLALSWVPRYAICAAIVLIYLFIYFYIRRRMGDFGRRHSEATQPRWASETSGAISMPRLRYHGLLSRPTSTTDTILAAKDQLRPPSSTGPTRSASARTSTEAPRRGSVKWNWTVFAHDQQSASSRPSADESCDPISPSSPGHLMVPPSSTYGYRRNTIPTDHVLSGSYPGSSSSSSSNYYNLSSNGRRISLPPSLPQNNSNDSRAEVDADTSDSSPMLPVPPASLPPPAPPPPAPPQPPPPQPFQPSISHFTASFSLADQDTDVGPGPITSKQLNNKRTIRQLRSLFVYPLAYIVIWLFPFVSHVLGYDDDSLRYRGKGMPHWLFIVSTISLAVQGTVNCTLFLLRETPWRHMSAEGKKGFWVAFGRRWGYNVRRVVLWCGRGWVGGWKGCTSADGVGRTREEMLVDGRLARERREEEVAVERERRRGAAAMGLEGPGAGSRKRREWWDVYSERDGILDYNDSLDGADYGEEQVQVPQEVG
ncbi:hypothetical protein VTH82DRAFT_4688 [Thermothelomyces myriococcoides]